MKSAYRHCAVHPRSRKYAAIVVGDPNTKTLQAFRLKALPFGSVKSVHSFLRVSHSIWGGLDDHLHGDHNELFDDFISLATVAESQSVDFTVKAVFRMLGWKFAEDGPKAPPFSPAVTALGVSVDVSDLHQGLVLIDNTEKRALELLDTISSVIQSGRMTKKEALRLRGRMQFASGQIFGRVAKRCLSDEGP